MFKDLTGFDKASIMQFPTGKWGFVGLVPVTLIYDATEEEIARLTRSGCTQFLKRKGFATEAAAMAALAEVLE